MYTSETAVSALIPRSRGSQGESIRTWYLCAIIILAPMASAARGIDPSMGRSLIALIDVAIIAMFVRNFFARPSVHVLVVSLILYCAFQWALLAVPFPGLELAAQGFRKSLLLLLAISVGMLVPEIHKEWVRNAIAFTLFYVCLYGIKQHFQFDSFDTRLLAAQSSDIYSNMFGGQIRAMSLLSGAFHLGTAACALAAFAIFGDLRSKWLRTLLYVVALAACYASITRTYLILILVVPVATWMLRSSLRLLVGVYFVALAVLSTELFTGGSLSELFWLAVKDPRLGARLVSYNGLVEIWSSNPIGVATGFGLGSAGSALGEDYLSRGLIWIEPHNIYAKYLFEMGIVMGSLALSILFSVSWKAVRNKENAERWFILALVLIVAISGMTITSVEVWPVNWFVGILVGMAIPLSNKSPCPGVDRSRASGAGGG